MRLLPLLLLLPLLVWGAEKETEPAQASEEQSEEAIEEKPEPDQLRSRKLSTAFKDFRPSEAISADNAVSFPVDI